MAKKRNRKNNLENWEVAIVKAMFLKWPDKNDQDLLAYFTRPTRSVNHRLIAQIKKGDVHGKTKAADKQFLDGFLENWPLVDPDTGLHLYGDELLIKAREAMLAAVQTFNNPRANFRSEIFIVTAIIAWTYLFHAHYKTCGIDYRYYQKSRDGRREVKRTKHGAEKYWELSQCISSEHCPIDAYTKNNLKFLIEIRHEIEHQMTTKIDNRLGAKLHACCLNFERVITQLFGDEFGLEKELGFAIQFSGFESSQIVQMAAEPNLPNNIGVVQRTFEQSLTEEEFQHPHYAHRIVLFSKTDKKRGDADDAVVIVQPGSPEAEKANRVILKDVERPKFKPGQIVSQMKSEGFHKFNLHAHTLLWKKLNGKKTGKGYGILLSDGNWYWYERWLEAVRQHCQEHDQEYV